MKPRKKFFRLSTSQWISVAVLGSSVGLALAVTLPFPSFTAGTPISASEVNQNFAALATAVDNVYTKSEIDASVANGMKAAGRVGSTGTVSNTFASFGTFTASRSGVGQYSVNLPGLMPGCTGDWPLIMLTLATSGMAESGVIATTCASGDTSVFVTTRDIAGTAADRTFNFVVYHRPAGALPPFPARAPLASGVCQVDANGVETCQ